MTDSTMIKIIELSVNYRKPGLTFETNWWSLVILFALIVLIYFIRKRIVSSNYKLIEMDVEISGNPKASFKVKRDDSNIYIANRIYIELITRKAAIPLDEDNDVLIEIYDSWHKLFGIIRDEVKNVPGHFLRKNNTSVALIGLTTKILNEGLRPHLTEYQSKFRKWYVEEITLDSSKGLTPQQIQKKFQEYDLLVASMKQVNSILINYSNELRKLIDSN